MRKGSFILSLIVAIIGSVGFLELVKPVAKEEVYIAFGIAFVLLLISCKVFICLKE